MQKVKFVDSTRSQFFATARNRVDAYFQENGISKNANTAMWIKAVFFLTGYVTLYGLVLSNMFGSWGTLLLAMVLGMFASFIGFNVSHDAIHGSFSSKTWVNRLLSHSFYLLGANPYLWNITHNVVHHTYTNIPGHDEDIEVAPGLVRLEHEDKVRYINRFQHYYSFLLYGLASLSWVLRKDYVKFFQTRIGSHRNDHPRKEYFNLFFYKALYYVLFMVVPLLVMPYAWWQVVLGFLLMHFAEGLVLGLVFQLAHVVEGTTFPYPNAEGNIEECWAAHQLHTTANFSPNSRIAEFLCGGLNRQIEHHLFPKVCHIHYRAIANIVRDTAHEFGLPYMENPTFLTALQSHQQLLKRMGKDAYKAERKAARARRVLQPA